jgi:nucleoid DNA-binding protein
LSLNIAAGRAGGQHGPGGRGGPRRGGRPRRIAENPGKNRGDAVDILAAAFYLPAYCVQSRPRVFFARNAMAENKASNASKARPLSKSTVLQELATSTGLSRKQVAHVFDELSAMIRHQLGKKGPGVFAVPGLMKLKRVHKPATKARKGINPFTKQETTFKAKPARNVVKIQALKSLKDMIK